MTQATTQHTQGPQLPLHILGQYIKDFSFENPGAPALLSQLATLQPEINVTVNVAYRPLHVTSDQPQAPAPALFESIITIKASGKMDARPVFMVECLYAGTIALPHDMPENVMRGMLMVEAPRLLFPFARAIVSDAVRDGGYGPLMINPVDFMAMYQQQLHIEAQASQQKAGNA